MDDVVLDVWIYCIPNFKGFQMGFEMMLQYGQDFIFVKKILKKSSLSIIFTMSCVLPSSKFIVQT